MDIVITAALGAALLTEMHSKLQLLFVELPNVLNENHSMARATKILASLAIVILIARIIGLLTLFVIEREKAREPKPTFYLYTHIASCRNDTSPCAVCLCEGTNNITLQCGHSYHWTCVQPWLDQRNACPLCKKAQSRWGLDENGRVLVVETN